MIRAGPRSAGDREVGRQSAGSKFLLKISSDTSKNVKSTQDIACLPATRLVQLIRRRELSPVELMQACLARVEEHNGLVNAVCTLSDQAVEEAREAEQKLSRGESVGPLHGLPVGIKDITPTKDLLTTFGSPLYADHLPRRNALVVDRLKAAGAIVLGKTNTPEFAAGGNTFNQIFGPTRNPWNPRLSAGGSTGGGAAGLATGMIALAEGTDLGGSLRIPASFCGVVGLRPSPGLIPTHPTAFLWDSLQVTGPMARTAKDVALMLEAVCGPSSLSPLSQSVERKPFVSAVEKGIPGGLRVAYCPDIAGIGMDEQIEQVCRKASFEMSQAGVRVEEVELDLSFGRKAFLALRGFWMVVQQFARLDRLEEFGDNLGGNVRAGLALKAENLGEAEQIRGRIWELFQDLLGDFDYFCTPCMAVSPFPVEQSHPRVIAGRQMKTYVDWFAPTFLLSLTGLPVASVPCGLDAEGLPIGLQVVGRPRGEESVLALAQQIQNAHPIGLPPMEGLS